MVRRLLALSLFAGVIGMTGSGCYTMTSQGDTVAFYNPGQTLLMAATPSAGDYKLYKDGILSVDSIWDQTLMQGAPIGFRYYNGGYFAVAGNQQFPIDTNSQYLWKKP